MFDKVFADRRAEEARKAGVYPRFSAIRLRGACGGGRRLSGDAKSVFPNFALDSTYRGDQLKDVKFGIKAYSSHGNQSEKEDRKWNSVN